jgi:hypothetical protein
LNVTITGLQQAQEANLYNIAQMRPSGAFGRMIQNVTTMAQRYAVSITHVDTGALKASHRIDLRGTHGIIYLDPAANNPVSGARTAIYGPVEHARGGSHAFYYRTEKEAGLEIVTQATKIFGSELR